MPRAVAIGNRLADDGGDRSRRGMEHAGSEAAHGPQRQRRIREIAQVGGVLDDGEARADGETQHGGIDEETDSAAGDQHADEHHFRGLLGERRDIAGERLRVEAGGRHQPRVQRLAAERGRRSVEQRHRDRRGPHQPEACP